MPVLKNGRNSELGDGQKWESSKELKENKLGR